MTSVDEYNLNVTNQINVNSVSEYTNGAGITFNNNTVNKGYSVYSDISEPSTTPVAGSGFLFKKTGSNGIYWKPDFGVVTEINLVQAFYSGILYDAVVSTDGTGTHTLVSTAIASGAKVIFVRDGNYTETTSLNLIDGGTLIGESKNVVITFSGGISGIVADGSGGTINSTGTISVTNNSTTITGVGTTFTNLNPVLSNTYIFIDNTSYLINSISSDTSLTLLNVYNGIPGSGLSYKTRRMFNNIRIENLTLIGSTNGIYLRSVRSSTIRDMTIRSITGAVNILDSDNSSFRDVIVEIPALGLVVNNTASCNFDGCQVINSGNVGINLTGNSSNLMFNKCVASTCNNIGLLIAVGISNCTISNSLFEYNTSSGISLNGFNCSIANSIVQYNGSHGIYISSAINNLISGNNISSNSTNGISLYVSSTKNYIGGNTISNNAIGCFITSTCDNTIVTGNIIQSNSSDGINIGANRCMVSINRCVSNSGNGCTILSGATDVTVLSNNFQGNTGSNFSDSGTITSLEGILINSVDARSSTTLAIGASKATRINLAATGITTNTAGNLEVVQTLKTDIATGLTGNGILAENVRLKTGYIEFGDITSPINPGSGLGRLYKKTGSPGIFWKSETSNAEIDLTLAYGYSNNVSASTTITTTSTTHILAFGMTLTPGAGTYAVTWAASVQCADTNGIVYIQIYAGGSPIGAEQKFQRGGNSNNPCAGICCVVDVTVNGSQAIEGRWRCATGTGQMYGRNLLIIQSSP